MTPAASSTRVRPVLLRAATPLSTRGAWHKLSMLGTLAVVLVLPFVTTTGCEGKSDPVDWTGWQLLGHSLHEDALFLVGPLALVVAALVGMATARVRRAGRRALVHVGVLLLSLVGVLGTFVALASPTASDVEVLHAGAALVNATLLVFLGDSLVRTVLGTREWWRARGPTPRLLLPPRRREVSEG